MFTTRLTNGCVLVLLVCLTTVALAEEPTQYSRPVPPIPPENGMSINHSSTALEGALRGTAQVIHATGNYWLAVSQALICREEARWLALSNRMRYVEYRIALRNWRELDRLGRIAERRTANEASRAARHEVYRLSPRQFDRVTGTIAWPNVLLGSEYDELRGRLDELFREVASDELAVSRNVAEVARLVRLLTLEVRRIGQVCRRLSTSRRRGFSAASGTKWSFHW